MNRSYGALLVAQSRHRDLCADVARHRLATEAQRAIPRVALTRRINPVLAYARHALTAFATIAFGRGDN